MLDLGQVIGFDWDEANSFKSSEKHSVTQAEAEQVFADRRLKVADDARHSQIEARYHAMGRTFEGRSLHVPFTLRENQTKLRVISARNMNRKERAIYEQEA
jgi:uncharacterized protein